MGSSLKLVAKSSLIEKKTFVSLSSNCICGSDDCSTNKSPFFFLTFSDLSESGCLNFQLINWCHFCAIAILFVSYWAPMEATFLSWILWNGLSCAHKMRASNLKHKDSWFYHQQKLFVEGSIVRQLYLIFFPSFDSHFLSFQMSWAFSQLFHIGIWLSDFSFVVIFVLSRFCLSVIGVLWRSRSFRGFCQMG